MAYPKALIQRCLVHLERNVKGYISHKHYGRIAELFKKLRLAQGAEEGRHALLALKQFLRSVNHQAWKCVQRVGVDAIMIHLLNVPNSLHITFLSTNNIENIFSTARKKTGRVTRWDPATEMGSRWIASALMSAEKGFNRITGYSELSCLIDALSLKN
jgi:transposase-like protein